MPMSPHEKHGPIGKFELDAAMSRIDAQLERARSNSAKLDERERNYKELVGLLCDLPNKVAHPIMVPFGPLAFFPGRIEHTNEVLTQLSSEFFVLRTTKRASELASKRLSSIRQEKASQCKDMHKLEMMRGLASGEEASIGPSGATVRRDQEGFMDIREPYDEQVEQRKAAMASHQPHVDGASSPHLGGSHEDVLERLRELERQEMEESEDVDGDEGHNDIEHIDSSARMRKLQTLEEMEELDSIVEGAESVEVASHSAGMHSTQALGSQYGASDAPAVKALSPSDLFLKMRQVEEGASGERQERPTLVAQIQQRGDISRSPSEESPHVGLDMRQGVRERMGAAADKAFGGPDRLCSMDEDAPKRISKFKADRHKGRA